MVIAPVAVGVDGFGIFVEGVGISSDDVGTAAGCGEFLSQRWIGGQGCGGPRVSVHGSDGGFGRSDDAPAIGLAAGSTEGVASMVLGWDGGGIGWPDS